MPKIESEPSHIQGFSIRRVEGANGEFGRAETRRYRSLHRRYVREYRAEQRAKAAKEKLKKQEVYVAEEFGVVGGADSEDNSVTAVFPETSRQWNHEKLREALGDAYSAVVHEDVSVTVRLVPGMIQEDVVGSVTSNIASADINPDQLVTVQTSYRIDEKEIAKMVKDGLVLPEGTFEDTTTWKVTVNSLDKSLEAKTKRRKVPQYFPSKK